jgi:hypothetical protein
MYPRRIHRSTCRGNVRRPPALGGDAKDVDINRSRSGKKLRKALGTSSIRLWPPARIRLGRSATDGAARLLESWRRTGTASRYSIKNLERDGDSTQSHHALVAAMPRAATCE